jgi:hypothetical protein
MKLMLLPARSFATVVEVNVERWVYFRLPLDVLRIAVPPLIYFVFGVLLHGQEGRSGLFQGDNFGLYGRFQQLAALANTALQAAEKFQTGLAVVQVRFQFLTGKIVQQPVQVL